MGVDLNLLVRYEGLLVVAGSDNWQCWRVVTRMGLATQWLEVNPVPRAAPLVELNSLCLYIHEER